MGMNTSELWQPSPYWISYATLRGTKASLRKYFRENEEAQKYAIAYGQYRMLKICCHPKNKFLMSQILDNDTFQYIAMDPKISPSSTYSQHLLSDSKSIETQKIKKLIENLDRIIQANSVAIDENNNNHEKDNNNKNTKYKNAND